MFASNINHARVHVSRVLPPLINGWVIFIIELYTAGTMTPIIDC